MCLDPRVVTDGPDGAEGPNVRGLGPKRDPAQPSDPPDTDQVVGGQALHLHLDDQVGAAQHRGLGTTLLKKAERIAKNAGYSKLVVIAAIGTRLYYEKRGFIRSGLYMTKNVV